MPYGTIALRRLLAAIPRAAGRLGIPEPSSARTFRSVNVGSLLTYAVINSTTAEPS